MTQHADALAVLGGWRAPDLGQERLRAAYVANLRSHADATTKACFPAHLTASTLVLADDGGQVLLTLHRKARRWFQFGGHLEPGDATLADAARREAIEESGLAVVDLDRVPVHLSAHPVAFCHPDGEVQHHDVRYVATVPAGTPAVVSDESLDVRWFDLTALPTDEPELLDLIRLARARVGQKVTRRA